MEFEWVPSTQASLSYESIASGVNVLRGFYLGGRNLMSCCHSDIMIRYDYCTSNESSLLLIEWSLHAWQCWNRVYSDSISVPLFEGWLSMDLKWNLRNWSSSHYQAWDPEEWWLVTQPSSIVWQELWGIMEPQFSRVWPSIYQVP